MYDELLTSAMSTAKVVFEKLCKAEFCETDSNSLELYNENEGIEITKDSLGYNIILRAKFKKRFGDDKSVNVIISNKIRDYILNYDILEFDNSKIFKCRIPNKVSNKIDEKYTGKRWYRTSHALYVLRVSLDGLPSNDDGYIISILDIPPIQVESIQIDNNELTIYAFENPKYMLSGKDDIIVQFIPFKSSKEREQEKWNK